MFLLKNCCWSVHYVQFFRPFAAHAPIFRLRDFIFFLPQNFDFAANFVGKQSVILGATGSGWKPCRSIQALIALRSLRFFSLDSGESWQLLFSTVGEEEGKVN